MNMTTAKAIDETTELDTVTVYALSVHNPFEIITQRLCVIIKLSCNKKWWMPLSSDFVNVHYIYSSRMSNSDISKIFLP